MAALAARLGVVGAAVVLCLAAGTAHAQRGTEIPGSPTAVQNLPQSGPTPPITMGADDALAARTAKIEHDQEKARNSDRQKKLVEDTERLLALATALKSDVDKTNKDTLSVDVIRKADEIEKLAHSVKEKMKGS